VSKEDRLIAWPPEETKPGDMHVLPLAGEEWTRVTRLLADARTWCPYLFHGRLCAPGRKSSKEYGCIGNNRKVWATACASAGLPVGRKNGGYVFHHTRNTASTDLRAHGMEEADAMKVTGHKTSHVFRHYDLGDVEALRTKLTKALAAKRAANKKATRKVRRLVLSEVQAAS
jgi:integrase